MQHKRYSIKTILDSVFVHKGQQLHKRLIYNNVNFGGLDSKWIKLLFVALPFLMYAAVFNPFSFEKLGIAQAIVFYIILLVFAMQIVMGISYLNNKKVLKHATEAWEEHFPDIDFKMILSSGATPYADFDKYYKDALDKELTEDALNKYLRQSFVQMEKENSILADAIRRDKIKRSGNNNG